MREAWGDAVRGGDATEGEPRGEEAMGGKGTGGKFKHQVGEAQVVRTVSETLHCVEHMLFAASSLASNLGEFMNLCACYVQKSIDGLDGDY